MTLHATEYGYSPSRIHGGVKPWVRPDDAPAFRLCCALLLLAGCAHIQAKPIAPAELVARGIHALLSAVAVS